MKGRDLYSKSKILYEPSAYVQHFNGQGKVEDGDIALKLSGNNFRQIIKIRVSWKFLLLC